MTSKMMIGLAATAITFTCMAQNVYKFNGDTGFEKPLKQKWAPNGADSLAGCSIVPGGKTGNALQMNAEKASCEVYSAQPIPVVPDTDTLNISIQAKGTGAFLVMLFCYKDNAYLDGVVVLRGECKDANAWNEYKVEYKFDKTKFKKYADLQNVRLALKTLKGGKILFDDLNCEKVTAK